MGDNERRSTEGIRTLKEDESLAMSYVHVRSVRKRLIKAIRVALLAGLMLAGAGLVLYVLFML